MKNDKDRLDAQDQIRATDQLPEGEPDEGYLKEDREWPRLENRLGQSRILIHRYFTEVLGWIKQKDNPDNFSYFEAGCGHGNDLRAIRKELEKRGRFLGVDLSRAEIMHGLNFYKQRDNEDSETAKKLFAVGNLGNLRHLNAWDQGNKKFSQKLSIDDGEFDLIYIEAVLHSFGYGYKTYREKKAAAQQFFNELARICKSGGKFFGRAIVFASFMTEEQRFKILRQYGRWHFYPTANEFKSMLEEAGFKNIKTILNPHEKAQTDPSKKNMFLSSFLAER
jgi:SAM-dependent methyltransferase